MNTPVNSIVRALLFGVLTVVTVMAGYSRTSASALALDRFDWTNYTNINTVLDVASRGDTVWLATTGGLAYLPGGVSGDVVRLTNREGLGGNTLAFVAFGPEGSVWTGGSDGRLSRRWSDIGWSVYPFMTEGAPIPLTSAVGDANGFLWVGSNSGLHKFDIHRNGGEIKESYTRIGNWTSSAVSAVIIEDGRLWIAGTGGIASADFNDQFLLDPSRWTSWTSPGNVLAVTLFDGTLWAGTGNGLWRFDGDVSSGSGSWALAGYAGNTINDLHGRGDTLWIASNQGLATVTPAGLSGFGVFGTPQRALTSLTMSSDNALWCGTDGDGVLQLLGSSWEIVTFDGPVDNDISDVTVDNEGRVWCVHPTRGLDFLDGDEWAWLMYTDALVGPSAPAMGIDVAPDGHIWFSMWGSGGLRVNPANPFNDYTRYDTANSGLMFVVDPGGPNNFIVARDVSVDDAGRVWFANAFADSGVRIVYNDDGCWGQFGTAEGISSNDVQVINAQPGYLLIGFGNSGIGEFVYNEPLCAGGEPSNNGGVFMLRRTADGLPSDQVQSILIDRADTLWVGTSAGLVQWVPDFRRFLTVALPADAGLSINALASDAFNTIWVGTSRGLVARRSNGEIDFYTPQNSPLVGRDVRAIAIDDREGVAWIATGSGLSRILTGAAPVDNVRDVQALPNPFEIVSGENREVRFNAPFGSRVYIYTVSGTLVFDLDVSQPWNGRTRDGALVASGVYLFVVRGPNGDYGRGKLAVIQAR
jgi:ligand-binding sensor domain-containing protein